MDNNENNYDKSDEIISPMFGHNFQNRVVAGKNKEDEKPKNIEGINYLEKQIEEELEAQTKIEKVKEYQESLKTDTDVLKQYHKQKEHEEIKATLPSNYLNFRDSLDNSSDLSTISEFSNDIFSVENTEIINDMKINNTISEIVDEIFDKVED